MDGSNDPEINSLLDKFKISYRSLEYTGVCDILSKIDDILEDDFMKQFQVNVIANIALPLLYPSESGSSKLRWTLQCITASKLVKWAPTLRIDILISVISVFEKYPQEFATNTAIRQTATDLITYSKNFWDLLHEVKSEFSADTIWSFLIFCSYNSTILDKPNWDLMNSLIQNPSTFNSSYSEDVLTFLTRTAKNWGQNPQFAFQLLDGAVKKTPIKLGVSIPAFIVEQNTSPKNKIEKLIYTVASHLKEANPLTARALTQIVMLESKIPDKVFVTSLYLALLRNIPQNFHPNLVQKLVTLVRTNQFEASAAAKIVAVTSTVQPPRNFSFLSHFMDSFASQTHSASMFFGHLAEVCELLSDDVVFPLVRDSISAIRSMGTNFGVMHLLVRLLKRAQSKPSILSGSDLNYYIQTIVDYSNQSTKLSAKCLARLAILNNNPLNFDTNSISSLELTTLVCAYSFNYGSNVYDDSLNYTAFVISKMCNFETSYNILSKIDYSRTFLNGDNARTIYLATKEAIKLSLTKNNDVFSPLSESLTKMLIFQDVTQIISDYFTSSNSSRINPNVLSNLITALDRVNSNYEPLRNLLITVTAKYTDDWVDTLINERNSNQFRSWFVMRVLRPLAMKCSGAFYVLSEMKLGPIEFASVIPAAKKWLTIGGANEVRAAAIKFVEKNLKGKKELTQFTLKLAFSIITRCESPSFPDIDIPDEPLIDFDTPVVPENRTAPSAELAASLRILCKAVECGIGNISDQDLDIIHRSLKHSKDPRVRRPYIKFLGRLGLRGAAYAAQMDPKLSITPFF
ncbi:hypothetical protein TVAG_128900 [Trichomonas vaginalis G3]|uniref:Uncharacterized protein n=1 Tax=Trichomonas vaginalis (strain ATCC PRA-98 / G3) TaxID=412133 RepID=A2E4E1_TRIV3|nr:hypothetical protein TVAGG3_0018680 [Trichomonas vaginalis G3]EAY12476.1 hypothetical protein TVAG_128900 [Trichomonas vaginalis G3]KAI5539539.1 hypothetical protein TVAGG3_0018680 [Trichomonas vaginalis G3]|eukprot:XP_001324699.1 hypothetical protein [Trichomonas vaginalis G3]